MGRWMPESHDSWDVLLGEYPWHPSARETIRDWEDPRAARPVPVSVLVTSAWYRWEGGGYDYSVDDTISGLVPSPPLLASLGLCWNGQDFQYADSEGKLVACDPSARERGPHALLIDKDVFARFLEQQELSVVWTILGEKQVLGPRVVNRGRLEVYGVLALENDAVRLINLGCDFVGPESQVSVSFLPKGSGPTPGEPSCEAGR